MTKNLTTKEIYDTFASKFEKNSKDYITKYLQEDINLFMQKVGGKKILDLGSGPGRDSLIFKKNGFEPTCIDISTKMIELCKEKGLKAYEMDMENLKLDDNYFDGIWAYTSFLHIPKNKFDKILQNTTNLLKEKGIFYIGMKKGYFEGYQEKKVYDNNKIFVSLYSKNQLKSYLEKLFNILHFSEIETTDGRAYLNFLCEKK